MPDIYGKILQKKVEWIELEIDMISHLNVKKYCNPTEKQIMTSSILYPQHDDVDIMVILGEPLQEESEYYVLACLFLKNHSWAHYDRETYEILNT